MSANAVAEPAKPQLARAANVARLMLLAILTIALLAVAVRTLAYWTWSRGNEWTDDALVGADQVVVTSKITERVARLLVDTNQPVRRGQAIVLLDDRDEQTRLAQVLAQERSQAASARAYDTNVSLIGSTQDAQDAQNRATIAQARAAIETSRHDAEVAERQRQAALTAIATAKAQFLAAQAMLPGYRADAGKSARDVVRARALRAQDDLPQSQLDAYEAAAAQARSQLDNAASNALAAHTALVAAQERYGAASSSAESAASQIRQREGELANAIGHLAESSVPYRVPNALAQAEAARAQTDSLAMQAAFARDQLSYTRIASPVDGYVGLKNVEAGTTVAPGQPLMTIVPRDVYVTANYRETQIARMRVGMPVTIRVDAYGDRAFAGHVQYLGPAADSAYALVAPENVNGNFVKITQRLPIRVLVDRGVDAQHPLRPGMSVETTVSVSDPS